ncbi:glycerol-3-phosphate 1-O-acyltransferase PlsY [Poriferisphaera corsica]|nr:glycerol-3-phosphate 1-O-acyltransferase PlsY [Poriferisphaera corsica]
MSEETMYWIIWLIGGYLCGSVPFGLLIGRLKGVDVREHGSKNIGATNTGRVLGKKWGILCFLLDVLKGCVPVLGYGIWSGLSGGEDLSVLAQLMWLGIAVVAVCGHMFPVWLRFKGGKGVATGLGVLLGFWPILTVAGLIAAITWLVVVNMTAYVSLASVLAAGLLPAVSIGLTFAFGGSWQNAMVFGLLTGALAGAVIIKHRSNITRLKAGEENKVGWGLKGKKLKTLSDN